MQFNLIQETENKNFYYQKNERTKENAKPTSNKIVKKKMDELDNTFTKKFTAIKNPKRAKPRKYIDSDNLLDAMDRTIKSINGTIAMGNDFYDQKLYAKAAELYESVIKIKNVEKYLEKDSYNGILKDIYLCHYNLWRSSANQKEKWLQIAFDSLSKLLTELEDQTTNDLFYLFADKLYKDALKEIGRNNTSALHKLCLLLEIDLKFQERINIDTHSLFNQILFQMQTSIMIEKSCKDKMIEEMLLILVSNKSMERDLKVSYLNWLEDYFWESDQGSDSQEEMEITEAVNIIKTLKRPNDENKYENNLFEQNKKQKNS